MSKNTNQNDYENCIKVIKGRNGELFILDVKD